MAGLLRINGGDGFELHAAESGQCLLKEDAGIGSDALFYISVDPVRRDVMFPDGALQRGGQELGGVPEMMLDDGGEKRIAAIGIETIDGYDLQLVEVGDGRDGVGAVDFIVPLFVAEDEQGAEGEGEQAGGGDPPGMGCESRGAGGGLRAMLCREQLHEPEKGHHSI